MIEIFNKPALTKRQRFTKAVFFGTGAAIICVAIYLLIFKLFHVVFSLLFVGFGFFIGYTIQHFGRGVQIQFSILGAALTLCTIMLCDILTYHSLNLVLYLFTNGIDGLLMVGYRLVGIYFAYRYSRIF